MPARSKAHAALGAAIRELRAEIQVSQEALALRADLDRAYMGTVERGEANVALENLVRIAAALGVPTSALLARAERRGLSVKGLPARKPRPSPRRRRGAEGRAASPPTRGL